MAYIVKHWRGELSLKTSFWVNLFLINLGFRIFQTWFDKASPIENPVLASRVTLIYVCIALAIVYPWQIIGLWRSANRHIQETGKRFWAGSAKVLVVLGILATLGKLSVSWPGYRDIFKVGFGKDEYGDYQVELVNGGSLIHINGGLGFGISKKVNKLIAENPSVKGIILDSYGGSTYEARELSKSILAHGLDTYTLKGCYSACGVAFISGNKRCLAKGANLGFHQSIPMTKSFTPSDMLAKQKADQKKDLMIYQRQGISQDFINNIFIAKNDDLWCPTVDEMLKAGVVHEVVNPSDLQPIEYGSVDTSDVEKALKDISVYQAIKKHDPKTDERCPSN